MYKVLCWAISHTNLFSPIANPLSLNEYPHSHSTDEKTVVRFVFQKDPSDSTREYGLEEARWEAGRAYEDVSKWAKVGAAGMERKDQRRNGQDLVTDWTRG